MALQAEQAPPALCGREDAFPFTPDGTLPFCVHLQHFNKTVQLVVLSPAEVALGGLAALPQLLAGATVTVSLSVSAGALFSVRIQLFQ